MNEKLKQLGETILESAKHCRKLEDIKLNDAHDRDPRIEELIEAPVALLSTSPEREDTIQVQDPFSD